MSDRECCPVCGQFTNGLYCPRCDDLFDAPLELPPGISQIRHHCPMLVYDGHPNPELLIDLLPTDPDDPNYLLGHCPECGVSVRSRRFLDAPEHTDLDDR